MSGRGPAPSNRGPSPRAFLTPALALLALLAALLLSARSADTEVARDDHLCRADRDSATGVAMFLLDFRKPLDASGAATPGRLLRTLTRALPAETELRVLTLTDSPAEPLALLGRLCKPYDSAALQRPEAKDQHGAARDCDDLPTQIGTETRDGATRFCSRRAALERRLDALAAQRWDAGTAVSGAYLVEAMEHVRAELAALPGQHALHVFSDMLQHARWYSHLDLEWRKWRYTDFADLLQSRKSRLRPPGGIEGMPVHVYYVPRAGVTDRPRQRTYHQAFWREYFGSEELRYHDQDPMAGYRGEPLMAVVDEEAALERERAETERLMREVRERRAELERERRELDALQRERRGSA